MRWPAAFLMVALAGCTTVSPGMATAAGPWRGQVVDAETGQSLEGVVVVAVWDKMSPGAMHPKREFHDVDEVVTDADGRFVLPERRLLTANPLVSIEGPELMMFRGGYGQWAFRGAAERRTLELVERVQRGQQMWKRFLDGEHTVFELASLKTREARFRFIARVSPPARVPATSTPRLYQAVSRERLALGLEP
jgi:hypothetical protein